MAAAEGGTCQHADGEDDPVLETRAETTSDGPQDLVAPWLLRAVTRPAVSVRCGSLRSENVAHRAASARSKTRPGGRGEDQN